MQPLSSWYNKGMQDLQGNNIDPLIENYRNALQEQYDANVASLNQQRANDQQSIMSNANVRGMMYSNFPERDKVKYDTSTYTPSLVKLRTSYQTGLDSLRNNAINAYNQLRSINEAIDHLNSMS